MGNRDVYDSEGYNTCIHFILNTKLDQYLINKDFSRFAAGYNGPGYKKIIMMIGCGQPVIGKRNELLGSHVS